MGSMEWILVVGFVSVGFLLFLIRRELAALRTDFRQTAAFLSVRLSNERYKPD
jgi:hypothetical protein